jgi:hypothetical protein
VGIANDGPAAGLLGPGIAEHLYSIEPCSTCDPNGTHHGPCRYCWADGRWERGIPRVATGVKDRVAKLKALGNGLMWQVPFAIGKTLAEQWGEL